MSTFRIKQRDYKFEEIIAIDEKNYMVSFEHTYESLTREQFGVFLVQYGQWMQKSKMYADGWYKAKSNTGDDVVLKLVNNKIYHPSYSIVGTYDINRSAWGNLESIDPNSDEFFSILQEMIL